MAKNNVQLAKVLIESIEELINSKLGNLRLNRKKKAVIQFLNVDGTVNLTIDGEEYNDVKVRAGLVPQVGEVVFVEIPNNQFKDMFVDTAKILISTDEESNHTHNNLSVLQTITQTLINKWNTVTSKADKTYVDTELGNKVDKVVGKGLSAEDYSTTEKNKLAGIENGANKYTHPSTHSLDIITETTSKKILTATERVKISEVDNKVNKIDGKSLSDENYTLDEKNKLAGIEAGANKYSHPSTHPASIITESSSRRFVSDSEKSTWNTVISKADKDYVDTELEKKANTIDIPTELSSFTKDINFDERYYTETEMDTLLGNKVDNSRVLTNVPINAKFSDTIYVHPTTAGNKHIPTGGSVGQVLKNTANGTVTWQNEYTYTHPISHSIGEVSGLQGTLDEKVDNSRVLTDVPLNAKFTDTNTTYSEITTAEIDLGTASTLRAVTARRVQYILDKVSTMISTAIGSLTKSSVGLSNVDNTSDLSKPISTATQTALNGKVNNNQVLTNVPSGAKFTDTITTVNNKTGAISKADIVALGIPSENTTYGLATTAIDGLMSKSDKVNLNSNTSARHTHTQKDVLDKLTDSDGKLLYNGELISGDYNQLANKPLDDNFYGLGVTYSALGEDELLIYQQSTSSYKKINKEDFLSDASSSDYVLIIKRESFISTLNQTLFTLTQGEYVPNNSRVKLYIGGLLQPDDSFVETSPTNITLKHPIDSGADVVIEYIQLSSVMDYVHAQSHKTGGSDPITPQDIGAEPSFNKNTAFNKNFGTTAGTVCQGNDSRLSNARVPLAHDHNEIYYTESEVNALLTGKVDSSQVLTDVPLNAKFTDTNTITTVNGKTGAISKADIVALGIPAQDTVYTHPTASGNKHIPIGGASGQFLKWSTNGTAIWDTVPGGLELGDGSGNAYPGNKGKVAYDHSQTPHNYEPANSNIQTHIGTTGNPHGTTKSNVGLGSVLNYGLATQAEAEAGASNIKYMTPLRTKQAIDSNKPYHAGISPPSSTNLFWVDTR